MKLRGHGMLAFGPVPSRRLGRSLGINNIPPKTCTYSCIYCQVGRTKDMEIDRRLFYPPQEIFQSVSHKVNILRNKKEAIDYLSFVPDGEPTLDINLGKEIELLRELDIKIAVISNASLLWKKDVQQEVSKADLVSLKVDAVTDRMWRKINRPHKSLDLERILSGVLKFSRSFKGVLITETMLLKGINDSSEEIRKIGDFIAKMQPQKSFISSPTRPPAEKVERAGEFALNFALQYFKDNSIDVELLAGEKESSFSLTGDFEHDLLSITSVHPIRKQSLNNLLKRAGQSWELVEKLMREGKLIEVEYEGIKFYRRQWGNGD